MLYTSNSFYSLIFYPLCKIFFLYFCTSYLRKKEKLIKTSDLEEIYIRVIKCYFRRNIFDPTNHNFRNWNYNLLKRKTNE